MTDGRPAERTDLALDALAKIRALDAGPIAQEFRDGWLGGRTLLGDQQAFEWLQSVSLPRPHRVVLTCPLDDLPSGFYRQSEEQREEWATRLLHEKESAFASSARIETEEPTIRFKPRTEVADEARRYVAGLGHKFWGGADSALAALAAAVVRLVAKYDWDEQAALRFVLMGDEPTIPLLTARISSKGVGYVGPPDPALSAHVAEITVRCRPQATMKQVAEAYDVARRKLLADFGHDAGERNRRTTSQRTHDLAILGFRAFMGEFDSWREAFDAYKEENPEDAAQYVLPQRDRAGAAIPSAEGKVLIGTFRRDTRAAFKRITLVDLDWRPNLRQTAPGFEVEVTDEEE